MPKIYIFSYFILLKILGHRFELEHMSCKANILPSQHHTKKQQWFQGLNSINKSLSLGYSKDNPVSYWWEDQDKGQFQKKKKKRNGCFRLYFVFISWRHKIFLNIFPFFRITILILRPPYILCTLIRSMNGGPRNNMRFLYNFYFYSQLSLRLSGRHFKIDSLY